MSIQYIQKIDSIRSTSQAWYNIMYHTINPKNVQYPEQEIQSQLGGQMPLRTYIDDSHNSPSLTFLLKEAARVVTILVRTVVTPPNAALLSAFKILCTASAIIFNIASFSKGFVISESFSVLMRCFTAYNIKTDLYHSM